jgi:MFS transporter, ACS family, hexuronate transporter
LLKPIKNLRWIIATLLFFATLINYMDRQLLSVIAPKLRAELHLTNTQYAYAVNSFLIAYGVMFTVGGWLIDVLRTRRGMALSLGLWSLASTLHTLVVGAWDLCFYRFLLGVSEPGNFTAAVKAVAAWFPTRERGVAIGIAISGTGVGAIVAPPVVVWLALNFGWRMAFLLPSVCGAILLPIWLFVYREPEDHPWITKEEREHILSDRAGESGADRKPQILHLLKFRQIWSFIVARVFLDPLGFFYWFWLPSYLVAAKGFTFAQLGKWLWIPYLAQGLGQPAGGYFSGSLIRRGMSPILARKWGLTVGLLLSPFAIISLVSSEKAIVLGGITLATLGIGWWGANYNAAVMDTVPRSEVSTASGIAASGGVLSSVILTPITGYAADHHAYTLAFLFNLILMAFSVTASWLLLKKPMEA